MVDNELGFGSSLGDASDRASGVIDRRVGDFATRFVDDGKYGPSENAIEWRPVVGRRF